VTGSDVAGTDVEAASVGPVTVVHLITTLTQGGAERVLSQVVPRPGEHPAERHVVVPLVSGGMFADELTDAGVEVRGLGMRPGRDLVRGTLRLARVLRELRPDLVVSWMYHACLLDLLARPFAGAAGRRARMVWFLQGSLDAPDALSSHARLTVRVLARSSRYPDAVAINSVAGRAQHEAVGFRPRHWVHLPNGCDTERFAPDAASRVDTRDRLGFAEDELVLLFLGRNHPEKGLDLLVDAIPLLDPLGPPTAFVLVGTGTDEVVVAGPPSCRVIALGERRDAPELLRASDALVLPSRTEGTPNAVIEAMATGIPCVVTDVGDCSDVVGTTGVVVATASVPDLLAGIESVRSMDADDRRRRGAAARDRAVARFALTDARARYRALWSGGAE